MLVFERRGRKGTRRRREEGVEREDREELKRVSRWHAGDEFSCKASGWTAKSASTKILHKISHYRELDIGHTMNKALSRLWTLPFVAIVTLCNGVGCSPSVSKVSTPPSTKVNGILVEVDTVYYKRNYLYPIWGVSGVATNTNDSPLRTIHIEFGAYDVSGTKIASAFATTGTTRPQSKWRFDAPFVSVIDRNLDIAEVKIDGINGQMPIDDQVHKSTSP